RDPEIADDRTGAGPEIRVAERDPLWQPRRARRVDQLRDVPPDAFHRLERRGWRKRLDQQGYDLGVERPGLPGEQPPGGDERAGARMPQDVLHLEGAQGLIDVHDHRARGEGPKERGRG